MEQIIFMHRNSYIAFISVKYCKCWAKGGLLSEKFTLWHKSPKKVPNPELYLPKEKICLEIGANLKQIVRLSHLYLSVINLNSSTYLPRVPS